ncbi:DUF4129 domain-containing protein [Kitasatospora sp. NPDC059327]|uniref:DUF4129 domain-containing protein n=1 Tax=Kitasatospora sp. NPDC059327 TaxID=3346803 RepID=UPI0036A07738
MNDTTQPSGPRRDGRSRSDDGDRADRHDAGDRAEDTDGDRATDRVFGSGGRLAGVLLVIVGLLVAASTLRPDGGPLGSAHAAVPVSAVGFVLLLALGALIVIGRFAVRYREEVRGLTGPTPWVERTREATAVLLAGAAVVVPVLMFVFHNRADTRRAGPSRDDLPLPEITLPSASPPPEPREVDSEALSDVIPMLFAVLGVILVIAVLVFVVLVLWRVRFHRRRPPVVLPAAPARTEDALAAAVVTGRRALTGADARAAVIACYAAMEDSLALSGVSRQAPDSPTELLERAIADDRVDPAPAHALTALFREARYSTHPMDQGHVGRAQAALDALAERLADRAGQSPEQAAAGATGAARTDRTGESR